MKSKIPSQKTWDIPKELERNLSVQKIGDLLTPFNQVGKSSFVIVDFYRKKLIFGSSPVSALTGHSKETIETDNFGYHRRIMKKEEIEWLNRMIEELHKVFLSYPENKRKELICSFDLIIKTTYQQETILNHKMIPFQLCNKGNIWLSLCHVTVETSMQTPAKAIINDFVTGKKYYFLNGTFVPGDSKILTQEQKDILTMVGKDCLSDEICGILGVSEGVLKKKKKIICDTLGVNTFVGAVYKAKTLGII